MTNDVVSKATTNYFEKYGEAATQRSFVGMLLKFNKFGEFCAGQDEQKIQFGTVLAAYMTTLCVGYIKWVDNRPVEVVMGPVAEGFIPPKRAELDDQDQSKWDTFDNGEPRDPWQFSNSLVFADLKSGELFTFSTSSKGGMNAIGKLSKEYGRHIRSNPDEVPLIELHVDSYRHRIKEYGEIRVPIFKVTSWIHTDKLPPIDGAPSAAPASKQLALLPEPTPVDPPAQASAKAPAARKKF
jgi:hypothetical protein